MNLLKAQKLTFIVNTIIFLLVIGLACLLCIENDSVL